jgi:hypothetical protein
MGGEERLIAGKRTRWAGVEKEGFRNFKEGRKGISMRRSR